MPQAELCRRTETGVAETKTDRYRSCSTDDVVSEVEANNRKLLDCYIIKEINFQKIKDWLYRLHKITSLSAQQHTLVICLHYNSHHQTLNKDLHFRPYKIQVTLTLTKYEQTSNCILELGE